MNYKYRFVDVNHVLTEKEHKQVLGDMSIGKMISILRDGKLIINMNLVSSVTETSDMTTEQEETRYSQLNSPERADQKMIQGERIKSGEGMTSIQETIKKLHFPFYKKMGWIHKDDCICKQNGWVE